MEINQMDAEYTYDYDFDIVNIKVKKEYKYDESVDLETGVLLDFNENKFPVNLEILSASKKLDVEKDFLINPSGDVNILIESNMIKLEVCFKNENEEYVMEYSNIHDENFKINDIEAKFALV